MLGLFVDGCRDDDGLITGNAAVFQFVFCPFMSLLWDFGFVIERA